MGFIEAVKTCFRKFATFSGRAKRSEYWWFVLFAVIINVVLSMLAFSTMDLSAMATDPNAVMAMYTSPAMILNMIIGLILFIPMLAAGSRRLHDTGKSGWWQLLWLLGVIPIVGLLGMIALIYLLVQKSQEGENKYG